MDRALPLVASWLMLGCSFDWRAPESLDQADAAIAARPDAGTHDSGEHDAAPERDDDASQEPSDGDAAAGGDGIDGPAIAVPGAVCTSAQAETLACDGHASRKSLKCSNGRWILFGTCDELERCQTEPGPLQGLCTSMPPECVGQAPETSFCFGTLRASCDADLLRVIDQACVANAHCDPNVASLCSCDGGFEDDGAGGCRVANDCAADSCAHGTCVDGVASFTCSCDAGFVGTLCEVNVDECASSACQNGSSCVDGVNGYTCACPPGYEGALCETSTDDCPANACANGFCIDQENDYYCACNDGYISIGHSCRREATCGGPGGDLCP